MELQQNEKELLRKSPLMWYKKKMQAFPGSLIITNQRVIFEQHRMNPVGGLLGALVSAASKRDKDKHVFSESIDTLSIDKGNKINKKSFKAVFTTSASDARMELMVDTALMEEIESLVKPH